MKKCCKTCNCQDELQDLQDQINNIEVDFDVITVKEECPVVLGYANINADGTVAQACGDGISVVTNDVGRKILTPPIGTISATVSIIEDYDTRDSITARLEDFTGQNVHTTEGDNGANPNTPRDRAFTIFWYGKKEFVTDIVGSTNGVYRNVNSSEYAETSLTQTNIHIPAGGTGVATQPATFVGQVTEGGWSSSANTFTYTGAPKKIVVDFNIRATDEGASNYWAKPILRITETVSGRVFWVDELAMQDNTAYDGTVVFDGSFVHLNPPSNPSYTFDWYTEENRTATLIPDTNSRIVLEAVTEYQTIVSS